MNRNPNGPTDTRSINGTRTTNNGRRINSNNAETYTCPISFQTIDKETSKDRIFEVEHTNTSSSKVRKTKYFVECLGEWVFEKGKRTLPHTNLPLTEDQIKDLYEKYKKLKDEQKLKSNNLTRYPYNGFYHEQDGREYAFGSEHPNDANGYNNDTPDPRLRESLQKIDDLFIGGLRQSSSACIEVPRHTLMILLRQIVLPEDHESLGAQLEKLEGTINNPNHFAIYDGNAGGFYSRSVIIRVNEQQGNALLQPNMSYSKKILYFDNDLITLMYFATVQVVVENVEYKFAKYIPDGQGLSIFLYKEEPSDILPKGKYFVITDTEAINSQVGGKAKVKYNGKTYKVRTGPRGGNYILVAGEKKYV